MRVLRKKQQVDSAATEPAQKLRVAQRAAALSSKAFKPPPKKPTKQKRSTRIKKLNIVITDNDEPLLGGDATTRCQTEKVENRPDFQPQGTQRSSNSGVQYNPPPETPAAWSLVTMESRNDQKFDMDSSEDTEAGMPSRYDAFGHDDDDDDDHVESRTTTLPSAPILGNALSEMTSCSMSGSDVNATFSGTQNTSHTDGTQTQMTSYTDSTQTTSYTDIRGTEKTSDPYDVAYNEHDAETTGMYRSQDTDGVWSDASSVILLRQKIAWFSIAISAVQLAILLIQLLLCGIASRDVNPMIGPYPDAFSEWGGKNAYLMLDENQYYRLITPTFLHVGLLHLLANVFCQLETCAYFEREWGSAKWLTIYFVSGMGAVATSCVMNPDEVGVSSSGALMGLFGAKIAQIITYTSFRLHTFAHLESVRLDRLGGVLCGTSLIFLLSLVTYIELSGHMGGLFAGFLSGMVLFCTPIASDYSRVIWGLLGFAGLAGATCYVFHLLWVETYPDEELADACTYFRNLYPEGYECDCSWE